MLIDAGQNVAEMRKYTRSVDGAQWWKRQAEEKQTAIGEHLMAKWLLQSDGNTYLPSLPFTKIPFRTFISFFLISTPHFRPPILL